MTETRLERYCVNFASSAGIVSVRMDVCREAGFPGRVFFVKGGRPLLVLFNQHSDDDSLKENQRRHLESLKKNGYNAMFCDSFKSFLKELTSLLANPILFRSQKTEQKTAD